MLITQPRPLLATENSIDRDPTRYVLQCIKPASKTLLSGKSSRNLARLRTAYCPFVHLSIQWSYDDVTIAYLIVHIITVLNTPYYLPMPIRNEQGGGSRQYGYLAKIHFDILCI